MGHPPLKSPFPSAWPPDCPPADAVVPNGTFYRLLRELPPAPEDFLTFSEAGKPVPPARACEAVGLSLFADLADARHYLMKFPHLGQWIASATLADQHGRVKATPRTSARSHSTWWPFAGIARHGMFQTVDT